MPLCSRAKYGVLLAPKNKSNIDKSIENKRERLEIMLLVNGEKYVREKKRNWRIFDTRNSIRVLTEELGLVLRTIIFSDN